MEMNLHRLKIEKLSSLVLGIVLSILYGIVEHFFITKHWSFENPFTKIVFWKFSMYHIVLMFPTFAIISFRPFIDEIIYYIKYRGNFKIVIDLVIYGVVTFWFYIMIEDLTWHVCWWIDNPKYIGKFCSWTLEPFQQIPYPWWYFLVIAKLIVYILVKKMYRQWVG